MAPRRLIVAIDGPAGAGKSTTARLLAERLGYALLDTGAIYRAMALRARAAGIAWDDGPGVASLADALDLSFRLEGTLNRVFANGDELTSLIRTPEISDGASRVSALYVSGTGEEPVRNLEYRNEYPNLGSTSRQVVARVKLAG